MKTEQFDEMQAQRRERIGSQSFFLLLYLLLLYVAADWLGFRWVDHSTAVMLLVLVCGGVYTVRTIAAGAFQAPRARASSAWARAGLAAAAAVLVALLAFGFLAPPEKAAAGDNGGILLAAACGLFLVACAVAAWIRRKKESGAEN